MAQSADEEALASARRRKLKIKKVEGYTVSVSIFNSAQTISVFKFPLSEYKMSVEQPAEVTHISEMAENNGAHMAVNACFWAVRSGLPTSYVKSNGSVLSLSHPAGLPRVNGLLFMYDDRLEIVRSTETPDYLSLAEKCDKCNNIIACGPVLLDDGEMMNYDNIINSTDPSLKRKKSFYTRRHPRSAVGHDGKGNAYFVVVDGRVKGRAEGMSIAELTLLCKWLGMTEAMNLDGGGSSSLWSRKYGTVSHPCDNRKFDHEGERKVSSALLATPLSKKSKRR